MSSVGLESLRSCLNVFLHRQPLSAEPDEPKTRSSNSQQIKLPHLWITFDISIIQELKGSSHTGNLLNSWRCHNAELRVANANRLWTSCLRLECLSDTCLSAWAAYVKMRQSHTNWESCEKTKIVAAGTARVKKIPTFRDFSYKFMCCRVFFLPAFPSSTATCGPTLTSTFIILKVNFKQHNYLIHE